MLSPNHVNYLIYQGTLVEEHVAGIPGDDFMTRHLKSLEEQAGIMDPTFNQTRIAKEFVKFNERCFVRLLGDMRAYNYVVDITPDIEGNQYRMRAIDFDQQSYEGWLHFYLPQYFKENNPIIFLGIEHMDPQTVRQYQLEERSLIAMRVKNARNQVLSFLEVMIKDRLSTPEKVSSLAADLANHHKNDIFRNCETMGALVQTNIDLLLRKGFKQSMVEVK